MRLVLKILFKFPPPLGWFSIQDQHHRHTSRRATLSLPSLCPFRAGSVSVSLPPLPVPLPGWFSISLPPLPLPPTRLVQHQPPLPPSAPYRAGSASASLPSLCPLPGWFSISGPSRYSRKVPRRSTGRVVRSSYCCATWISYNTSNKRPSLHSTRSAGGDASRVGVTRAVREDPPRPTLEQFHRRNSKLAVFYLRIRRNRNHKILSLDWFWNVANQWATRISGCGSFWFVNRTRPLSSPAEPDSRRLDHLPRIWGPTHSTRLCPSRHAPLTLVLNMD